MMPDAIDNSGGPALAPVPTEVSDIRQLVRDMGSCLNGGFELSDVAARHGVTETALLDWLQVPTFAAAVDKEAATMKATGEALRVRAMATTDKALARLQATLDREDIPTSTVVKIAETAHRISGANQDKPVSPEPRKSLGVVINFPDQSVYIGCSPEEIEEHKKQRARDVIDVEAVEPSPTDEGGA